MVEVTWVSSWGKRGIKDWNISFYMLGNKIETKGQTSSCSFSLRCRSFLGGPWVPFSPCDSNINPLILTTGGVWPRGFSLVIVQPEKDKNCFSRVLLMCTTLLLMPVIPTLIFNSIMIQAGDWFWISSMAARSQQVTFKGGALLHKPGDWRWPAASFLCSQLFDAHWLTWKKAFMVEREKSTGNL